MNTFDVYLQFTASKNGQHGRSRVFLKVPSARELYLTLIASGWDAVLATYRPEKAPKSNATVGDFLAELKEKADLKPGTLKGYAKAFRKIVSDIFEIGDGNDKCDYRGGGYQAWLQRVHAVKLAELTPDRLQVWKRDFLARAGDAPVKQRAAKTSVNSFIRRAKSLFATKTVKHLTVPLTPPRLFRLHSRSSPKTILARFSSSCSGSA